MHLQRAALYAQEWPHGREGRTQALSRHESAVQISTGLHRAR